jgi:hypothetical protein
LPFAVNQSKIKAIMPQTDLYHNAVKNALIKDGWTITHDPLTVRLLDMRLYIDLAAEKILTDDLESSKIGIEIKVFESDSFVNEFEKALGQYDLYQMALNQFQKERKLYLAVAISVYEKYFQRPSVQLVVSEKKINLMIFEPENEKIVKWIS